jgi:hypothetical protein
MFCRGLVYFALPLAAAGVRKLRQSSTNVVGVDIIEVAQMSPVDVGRAVPTGVMTIDEAELLNLKVWTRNVFEIIERTIQEVSDPAANLDSIKSSVQSLVDPGLAVHACTLPVALEGARPNCEVTQAPSETKNRFFDAHFAYNSQGSTGSLRFVVADDPMRATNFPVGFNVLVSDLQLDGSAAMKDFVGKNQGVEASGRDLDAERLTWVNSKLINALVTTTESWPWKCTRREDAAGLLELGEDEVQSFPGAIYNAITNFLAPVPGNWSVRFGASVRSDFGIQFSIEYALCGHLMMIPATIQSSS